MRRRRRYPGEERDVALGRALDELESPEYPDAFLAGVWALIDATEGGNGAEAWTDVPGRTDAATGGRLRPPRRSRPLGWGRPILAAAAIVAIVVAVSAAVLIGLPGVSRVTGPEPVSAAEVIRKALGALSSGKSIKADVTERYATLAVPGAAEYAVVHARIVVGPGGSYRTRVMEKQVGPHDAPWPQAWASGLMTVMPIDPYNHDVAYDAGTGVLTAYWRSSEKPGYQLDVTKDYPLGPPDRWANFQSDLGAMVLALRSGRATGVTTTAYEGRPAWVLTVVGSLALRSPDETFAVTIDQRTCLPVRVEAIDDNGVVLLDYSLHDVRVGEPLPNGAFTARAPNDSPVHHHDGGFRRVAVTELGQGSGYALLLPAWLPEGYHLRWSAVAERATTANGVTLGQKVLEVLSTRGFDTVTVTTRTPVDPEEAAEYDPVEVEPFYGEAVARDVTLRDGAWTGVTAKVVVAPRITVPHLWAVKDGVMLTVAGNATAEELVRIAESIRPFPSPTGSAPPGSTGD